METTGVEITDDSSLVEKWNVEIVALEGSERNIKITHEGDLALAEILLKSLELRP